MLVAAVVQPKRIAVDLDEPQRRRCGERRVVESQGRVRLAQRGFEAGAPADRVQAREVVVDRVQGLISRTKAPAASRPDAGPPRRSAARSVGVGGGRTRAASADQMGHAATRSVAAPNRIERPRIRRRPTTPKGQARCASWRCLLGGWIGNRRAKPGARSAKSGSARASRQRMKKAAQGSTLRGRRRGSLSRRDQAVRTARISLRGRTGVRRRRCAAPARPPRAAW